MRRHAGRVAVCGRAHGADARRDAGHGGRYIPATEVPGIGRITGTCWSFTDFIFGARHEPVFSCAACWSLGIAGACERHAPPKQWDCGIGPVIREALHAEDCGPEWQAQPVHALTGRILTSSDHDIG